MPTSTKFGKSLEEPPSRDPQPPPEYHDSKPTGHRRDVIALAAKLDVARDALAESLGAIDQMKKDAQAAKEEYDATNASLQAILGSSQDAKVKLANIRAAMKQDVDAFQALAGVPNVKRERWVAFFAGVLASTVSTIVVALVVWGWSRIF